MSTVKEVHSVPLSSSSLQAVIVIFARLPAKLMLALPHHLQSVQHAPDAGLNDFLLIAAEAVVLGAAARIGLRLSHVRSAGAVPHPHPDADLANLHCHRISFSPHARKTTVV